jgi:predicted ATPase
LPLDNLKKNGYYLKIIYLHNMEFYNENNRHQRSKNRPNFRSKNRQNFGFKPKNYRPQPPLQLDSITIKGFKSFKNLENFPMKNLNILVGANGAGKSNFLDFFEMIGWMIRADNLQEYVAIKGGAEELIFNKDGEIGAISSILKFSSSERKTEYRFQLSRDEKNALVFTHESYKDDHHYKGEILGVGHKEAKINQIKHIVKKTLNECNVHQFHNTSPYGPMGSGSFIGDNVFLKQNGQNIASVLYDLKTNNIENYNEIVRNIQLVLPIFGDFELHPKNNRVTLQWRRKGERNKFFGVNLTSDGTLRLIALITLLCMPENRISNILLLDEPELGLHPYAIEIVAELIKRFAVNKQVILATQSPQILNYFDIDNIIITEITENEGSALKRLSKNNYSEWLKNYQLGQMWQENIIGGNP